MPGLGRKKRKRGRDRLEKGIEVGGKEIISAAGRGKSD